MTAQPDHYAALGVSPLSDDVVIRAAYKAMMLKYHPDTSKSPNAAKRAAEINAAWHVLGDPERRQAYDQSRAQKSSRASSSGSPGKPPSPPPHGPSAKPPENRGSSDTRKSALGQLGIGLGGVVLVVLIKAGLHSLAVPSSPPSNGAALVRDNAAASLPNNWVDLTSNAAAENEVGNSASAVTLDNASDVADSAGASSDLQFGDIEDAARDFDRVLDARGISGARAFSEACHRKAAAAPTWSTLDRCAAFDYAASFMDEAMARATGTSPLAYFEFQKDHQAGRYERVSSQPWTIGERLRNIQQAANRVTYEILSTRLSKTRQLDDAAPTTPSQPLPPPFNLQQP